MATHLSELDSLAHRTMPSFLIRRCPQCPSKAIPVLQKDTKEGPELKGGLFEGQLLSPADIQGPSGELPLKTCSWPESPAAIQFAVTTNWPGHQQFPPVSPGHSSRHAGKRRQAEADPFSPISPSPTVACSQLWTTKTDTILESLKTLSLALKLPSSSSRSKRLFGVSAAASAGA